MESSQSCNGSSKRARAFNNGTQLVSCLVDGCNSDLNKCRDYHRRHKVCEVHSKTPKVTIGGQEQRFCQQCSRFHSLVEFDEGKRSCRKRLDGHNRRRRKPQAESLSFNSGRFLSSEQGTRFMPFNSPQVFPTCWDNNPLKPQHDPHDYNNSSQNLNFNNRKSSLLGSFSQQFSFQGSLSQPLPNHASSTLKIGGNGHKLLYDAVNNSDCALSLLSSPPQPPLSESLDIGLSHFMQTAPTQSALGSQFSGPSPDMNATNSVLGAADTYCPQGMFQIEAHHSSSAASSSSHHSIPFSWE